MIQSAMIQNFFLYQLSPWSILWNQILLKAASHKVFKIDFKKQRAIQHLHYPCGAGLATATWNYLKLAHSLFLSPCSPPTPTSGSIIMENIRPRLLLIQVSNLGSYSLFLSAAIQLQ